jgi:hypothetical protein
MNAKISFQILCQKCKTTAPPLLFVESEHHSVLKNNSFFASGFINTFSVAKH